MTANRRLAAIMVDDVIGYSKMMEVDVAGGRMSLHFRFWPILLQKSFESVSEQ